MKSRTSSKLGHIRPATAELHIATLERLKQSLKTYNGTNNVSTISRLIIVQSFRYVKVIRMHKSLDEFEFWSDLTTDYGAFESLKNRCFQFFSVAIDQIHFKFAGHKGMTNISNEFEFRPDPTTDYGIICP